jgi:hypothetical protein
MLMRYVHGQFMEEISYTAGWYLGLETIVSMSMQPQALRRRRRERIFARNTMWSIAKVSI